MNPLPDEFNGWLSKNMQKLISNRNEFIEDVKKYMNRLINDNIITPENYKNEISRSEKVEINSMRPQNNKLHDRLLKSNLDQFEDKGKFPDILKDLDLANDNTGKGVVIKVFRYTLSKLYLGDTKILVHNQIKDISKLDNNTINSLSAANMKVISQIFTNEQAGKAIKMFSISGDKLTLNEAYLDAYFKGESFDPEKEEIYGLFLQYFIDISMLDEAKKCSQEYYDIIKADEEKQKKAEIENNKQYNKALKFFGLK